MEERHRPLAFGPPSVRAEIVRSSSAVGLERGTPDEDAIAVLVIDANRLLRDEIAAILNAQTDLRVIAVASSREEAMMSARAIRPRVVLINAALGDHDRRADVESLRSVAPEVRVIVMDLPPGSDEVVEFVEAGASGFIASDATIEQVITTVRSVAAGHDVLPAALTGALFSHVAGHAPIRSSADASSHVRLTRREAEVVALIAEGLSNKEIAHRLNLTTFTVKSHVHSLLHKLELHSRLEIAARAHHDRPR